MTNSPEDHYETLAIDRDASPSVIKGAYLQLIQVHTPERNAEQFQRITEAYQTLSNPEKRKTYDAAERLPPRLQKSIEEILEEAGEDHDDAADNLIALVEKWPLIRALREMAGHHYMLADRPGEAAVVFRDLCDLAPENTTYMTRLGVALLKAGEDEEGVATLKAALAADPSNTPAYLNLSDYYMKEEQPEEAVSILNRGIHADGKLDAADLPLLIRLVMIHGMELAWDSLRRVGLMIRNVVPTEDRDARKYVASQLAGLIEPYSQVDRPDMLHFLFDLMADIDPENRLAARFRDQLTDQGGVWREKAAFFKSQNPPDWLGFFVHAMMEEADAKERKKLLDAIVIYVLHNRREAEARWDSMKYRFPRLAAHIQDRWTQLLELASMVGSRLNVPRATSPASKSGCLWLLASVALAAASIALAIIL